MITPSIYSVTAEPIRISPAGYPENEDLAGTLWKPILSDTLDPNVSEVGCWIIPSPPGDDRKGAYLALSRLAKTIAERGGLALQFDFYGCGESSGHFEDADWDRWLADIGAGIMRLEEEKGKYPYLQATTLTLFGGRLGARLAIEATEDLSCQLVFWDALYDAEAWFTEWRRRSRFRLGEPAKELSDNDLDGYLFSETLRSQLKDKRDIPPPPQAGESSARFIALAGDGRIPSGTKKWAEAWDVSVEALPIPACWLAADPSDPKELIRLTLEPDVTYVQ